MVGCWLINDSDIDVIIAPSWIVASIFDPLLNLIVKSLANHRFQTIIIYI